LFAHELTPEMVAVATDQGIVQVENRQGHGQSLKKNRWPA